MTQEGTNLTPEELAQLRKNWEKYLHSPEILKEGLTFIRTPSIREHEGNKYLRLIRAADSDQSIYVDVYQVLEAFGVTCPARQHAVKKLLCGGLRGKGNALEDLVGALAALNQAIHLERQRTLKKEGDDSPEEEDSTPLEEPGPPQELRTMRDPPLPNKSKVFRSRTMRPETPPETGDKK